MVCRLFLSISLFLYDPERISFLERYMGQPKRAVEQGVNLKAFVTFIPVDIGQDTLSPSRFAAGRGFAWHGWPHQSAVELRVDAADALAQHGADRVFLGRQRAHRYQIHHSLWRQLAGE